MRWAWASGFGGACAGDRLGGFGSRRRGGREAAGRGFRGWGFPVELWGFGGFSGGIAGIRSGGFKVELWGFGVFPRSGFLNFLSISHDSWILDVGVSPFGEEEYRFLVGSVGSRVFVGLNLSVVISISCYSIVVDGVASVCVFPPFISLLTSPPN
jgi:hypothetical protein